MKLTLGDNLRRLRKEHDLTQEQLADKLGVTYQSVSRWENGSTYPDLELIPSIAEMFSVTIDSLLGIPEAEKEKKAIAAYDDLRRECMNRDYDADRIVAIIRDIRRNYMDSQKAWRPWVEGNDRAFRDPKILPEVRLLAEAHLARHPLDMHVLQALAVIEDEEHIDEFLSKNAPIDGCSIRDLKLRRYDHLRNKEKYEPERKLFLYRSINNLLCEHNLLGWEREPEKHIAAQEFIRSFLELVRGCGSDTEPDAWAEDRLGLDIEFAATLAKAGESQKALEVLSKCVDLLENTMKITDMVQLSTSCPWLDGMACTAEESWHSLDNDPDSDEERMIFICTTIDGNFSVCSCVYPSISLRTLSDAAFDSLRENPQFIALSDRVKALVVTRPPQKA